MERGGGRRKGGGNYWVRHAIALSRLDVHVHLCNDVNIRWKVLPSPLVTSSHEVKQSWWTNPIEPEHLHGLNNGRLLVRTNSHRDSLKRC